MKKIRELWQAATLFERVRLLLSLLYVFMPVDFMPEAVFGIFGLFDDATAIGTVVWTLRNISRRLKKSRPRPDTKPYQVSDTLP